MGPLFRVLLAGLLILALEEAVASVEAVALEEAAALEEATVVVASAVVSATTNKYRSLCSVPWPAHDCVKMRTS